MTQESDKKHLIAGIGVFALLAVSWVWALKFTPPEEHMGEVYRIIYLHVPSAFAAFFSSFVLLVVSIWALVKKQSGAPLVAKASAEVGLIFTILTLATGSIWGRPTWGVWWDWDARLTTTLILALLYCGYLILYSSLHPGPQRNKICAALGILIAADVPIIYKSVTWWRTLHQPPTIMRRGDSTMAPEMLSALLFALAVMILVGGFLVYQRYKNLMISEELERLSYEQTP
ncbi:cytochrome c biogenesis protein CcsA [Pseudobacteriovorax antillogorgiicola]|uniref:Heme exporter protein C n=1 Tax=Pseudobacteriovorax antillogorgiicola TaxID=1513793 RepID=A0A1Y6C0R8_9BACT|nr:cytochrome c biogenesis protein CcsA [Pseudobacteriovorax antillogorgiicola]TCS52350.1 heme exporter protein C [Pseudobacteriovorax antillogorgiicola]SMF29608.1 heme exporter protein C [Pseudobacteriovorax antillogorgiicola]